MVSYGFSAAERSDLEKIYASKFNAVQLKEFFGDKKLSKIPEVIPKNVYNKQFRRNYQSFHDSYSTHIAKKFMRRWRTRLKNAENKYGVDKEVIVAIMLVETGLGRIKGHYHVPSVFASIVLGSEAQLLALATDTQKKQNQGVDYVKKLQRKIKWAKGQLQTLIVLHQDKKINVMKWHGSSSGAFGICQFIPSSYQSWGVDGDGSGYINLFTEADAIPSVANYLKAHGWKSGLQEPQNRKAVFAYNHSSIYVDTILKVAKTLQGESD